MNSNYTDITILLDRSGSMQSCKNDMEGAISSYLDNLKNDFKDRDIRVSLYSFDNDICCDFIERPLQDTKGILIEPRGCTALLDAMGKSILYTGSRLASKSEADRPINVLFVVITDGEENASIEYKIDAVKKMVVHQTDVYKWNFVYLGANQDSFSVGAGLGVAPYNSLNYQPNTRSVGRMSSVLYAYTTNFINNGTAAFTADDEKHVNSGD